MSRKLLALGAIAVMVTLIGIDPYSHGYVGGDIGIVQYEWQRWVAGTEIGLLVVGAILVFRPSLMRRALLIEASVFCTINALFVLRDGMTRFVTGYESAKTPLLGLLAGSLLRVLLLSRSNSSARSSMPVGESN